MIKRIVLFLISIALTFAASTYTALAMKTPFTTEIHTSFDSTEKRIYVMLALKSNEAYLEDLKKREQDSLEIEDADSNSNAGKLNLVVVLDRSGSMSNTRLRNAKEGIQKTTENIKKGSLISLVTFSNGAETVITKANTNNPKDVELFLKRLRSVRANGCTNLYAGMEKAEEILKDEDEDDSQLTKAIFLFTDGEVNRGDKQEVGELVPYAEGLYNDSKINISTFAFREDSSPELLEGMAKAGHGNYFYIDRQELISDYFATALNIMQNRMVKDITLKISPNQQLGFFLEKIYGFEESANEVPLGSLTDKDLKVIFFTLKVNSSKYHEELQQNNNPKFSPFQIQIDYERLASTVHQNYQKTNMIKKNPYFEAGIPEQLAKDFIKPLDNQEEIDNSIQSLASNPRLSRLYSRVKQNIDNQIEILTALQERDPYSMIPSRIKLNRELLVQIKQFKRNRGGNKKRLMRAAKENKKKFKFFDFSGLISSNDGYESYSHHSGNGGYGDLDDSDDSDDSDDDDCDYDQERFNRDVLNDYNHETNYGDTFQLLNNKCSLF